MNHTEIATPFRQWKTGGLNSRLVDISGEVLKEFNQDKSKPLANIILDQASHKVTE